MQGMFFKCAKLIRRWCIIQPEEVANQLEPSAKEWERRGALPPLLPWAQHVLPLRGHPNPDGQINMLESLSFSDRAAVIEDVSFLSPEPGNLLAPVAQPMLDLMGGAEHVYAVSYE
jgi:hypothetical protein